MRKNCLKLFVLFGALFFTLRARATPSSTYWAPSTASCQAWAVPHVTYDSYFNAEDSSAPTYPTDYGLTVGVLPFEKIQAELGVDYLQPAAYPLSLNGKICTPENSLFEHSPGMSVGLYNAGFIRNKSDMNVLYVMFQESIPGLGGYVALGAYHGFSKVLLTNKDGAIVQDGLLAALTSPDLLVGLSGLKKINFVADLQTGKNVLGAWGLGTNVFFSDTISLLTGPVFFFDKKDQPGNRSFFWTLQLDVDIPVKKL